MLTPTLTCASTLGAITIKQIPATAASARYLSLLINPPRYRDHREVVVNLAPRRRMNRRGQHWEDNDGECLFTIQSFWYFPI
jgi:hypothetical protein